MTVSDSSRAQLSGIVMEITCHISPWCAIPSQTFTLFIHFFTLFGQFLLMTIRLKTNEATLDSIVFDTVNTMVKCSVSIDFVLHELFHSNPPFPPILNSHIFAPPYLLTKRCWSKLPRRILIVLDMYYTVRTFRT